MADTIVRTFKFRIYPNAGQVTALEAQLAFACDLYNAALQQRRDAWKRRVRVNSVAQGRELTEIRVAGAAPIGMNRSCQERVLIRLDHSFDNFFRRVKNGETPGYPRFKSRHRYNTLEFRMDKGTDGCRLADRLYVQGVGHIKIRQHREIPESADPKTAKVTRRNGRWYVSISAAVKPEPLPPTGKQIGIDLGISTFAATSDGDLLAGPRAYRDAERRLAKAQRVVSRRQRGSHRRRKAVQNLGRAHEHIQNVRRDHAHKLARKVVNENDLIALEDLQVQNMVKNGHLSKYIHDQGWNQFVQFVTDKAESAGRTVVLVNPAGTSQECSQCGAVVKKALAERTHECPCGYTADRDINAARNILNRVTGPNGAVVEVVS